MRLLFFGFEEGRRRFSGPGLRCRLSPFLSFPLVVVIVHLSLLSYESFLLLIFQISDLCVSTWYNHPALFGERGKNDNAITHSSRGLTVPVDDGKRGPRGLFQGFFSTATEGFPCLLAHLQVVVTQLNVQQIVQALLRRCF